MAIQANERLIVVIEYDDEHMAHMWSDVERGWQEREAVEREAESIAASEYTPYGVTTATVCICCDQIKERHVTALWGCVVESIGQEGRYELENLGAISDEYLRNVAREVVEEARNA